jgi:hypothetical protein
VDTQNNDRSKASMTEMERLLAACSVWVDGKQGLDEQAALVLADWLEERGRNRDAEDIREVAVCDLWEGVLVDVLTTQGEGPADDDISPAGGWAYASTGSVIGPSARFHLVQARRGEGESVARFSLCLEPHSWKPGVTCTLELRGYHFTLRESQLVWHGEGQHGDLSSSTSWLLPRLRAVEHLFPELKLHAIRYICGYTADRLIATMAQDAKK